MSDIVLKDRSGAKNTYSGIDVINIADSDGIYNRYVAEPKGEIEITSNGTVNVKSVARAIVNVPNVIPDGYIKPSGDLKITSNGTFDVTNKASVTVAVEGGSIPEWNISDHTITGGNE